MQSVNTKGTATLMETRFWFNWKRKTPGTLMKMG